MTRLLRYLGSSAMVATLVGAAAIPSSAKPAHAVEQLTAWSSWSTPATDASLRKLIAIYNSHNPNVHWTLVSGCNIDETKVLSSVIAGNPPDMAFLGTVSLIGSWGRRGALVGLDPLIQRDHFDMTQFTHGSVVSVQSAGRQFAMPFFEDTYMLYYNTDDFKAAGLDSSKPPATISQLEAVSAKLTKTDSSGKYTHLGFVPYPLRTVLINPFGGHVLSKDGTKITMTDPGVGASTQWAVNFWKKYDPNKITSFLVSPGGNNPKNDFINRRESMVILGEWLLAQIQQDAPNLHFDVAPVPYLDGHPEYANSGSLGGNPLVIPKGSKDVNAAWDFLKWMSTTGSILSLNQPKTYYVADMDAVPALKVQVHNPKLAAGAFPNIMTKFWEYSASQNIVPWPDSLVGRELESEYYRQWNLAVTGKKTTADAMAGVNSTVQPDLDAALANLKRNQ